MNTKTLSLLSSLIWVVTAGLQVFALEDDINSQTASASDLDEIRARYDALVKEVTRVSSDSLPDGMLYPFSNDADCEEGDCSAPPESTIETTRVQEEVCQTGEEGVCLIKEVDVDKHWGSDKRILAMRDKLRKLGSGMYDQNDEGAQAHPFDSNRRPPVFLIPGLASTRLVAWKHKDCPYSLLQSPIKFNDYVWLNMKLLVQMGAIDGTCWEECMTLGRNQTDSDNGEQGCKLRPDEGLDAIASLAPGGLGAELLVGQTNTLFAWLVQWLADNLGYDLSNMVGFPYDWRLSPHMMEKRDGFLSHTRRRIEAAVKANGGNPGIVVAHSVRTANCCLGCIYDRWTCYLISDSVSVDGKLRVSILSAMAAPRNARRSLSTYHLTSGTTSPTTKIAGETTRVHQSGRLAFWGDERVG
jgi:hypothetical protein